MKNIYLKLIIAFIGLQICCIIKAAEEVVIDGIKYYYYGSYDVKVSGVDPDIFTGDLVIPETVVYNDKTYVVSEILGGAFYGCSNLQSVTIPNSVTRIGDSAFERCTSLSSLTFQERNQQITICDHAFAYCTNLPSVIMNGYVFLDEYAFYCCTGLQSVTCAVGYSGYRAFSGCINLQNVTLKGNSVWKLVFEDCDNIKTVTVSGKRPGEIWMGSYYSFPRKVCLTAILYVPEGSLESYRRSSWGEFVDIREYNLSGVEYAFANKMKVYASGKQLALDNISVGENIFVYKLDGSMVMNTTADSRTMRINLPTNNVYVIKVAGGTYKIFIP